MERLRLHPARYFLHVVPVLLGVTGALLVLVALAVGSLLDAVDGATMLRGFALAGLLWIGGMFWGVMMNELA